MSGSARGGSAIGGSEMKNVSCWSRAGCCWGTKRASKFQKPDSTSLQLSLAGYVVRGGANVPICGHLCKAHLKEDLSKFMPHFVHYTPQSIQATRDEARLETIPDIRGCKAPLIVGAPMALKLYGLKLVVLHVPLPQSVLALHPRTGLSTSPASRQSSRSPP